MDEYEELKEKIESLTRESAMSDGALRQLWQNIEKEHGCKTVEELEEKIRKLEKKLPGKKADYDEKLKRFKDEYESRIESPS